MKAEELRIGNFIEQGKVFEVIPYHVRVSYWHQHKQQDAMSLVKLDECDPIPLSEEVLLKCPKVERLDNKIFANYYRLHLKRNKYLIISDLGNPNLMVGVIETEFDNESFIEDCVNIHNWDYEKEMFLHQLQNLYYALTGEELEVKWG